ncbi:DUF945 family protein [Aquitalea sp. USM4]|uniref:DUF945 family protein n=1 Tax=Aquitalea sp. USM4 TaxID=1590041 RepID=UPI00103995D6|nr:DUF945 family protein [Aquitalea sp. USM4]QBJ79720.1 hypothetical protein DKK66_17600 [Aquitalea sp. USM4]
MKTTKLAALAATGLVLGWVLVLPGIVGVRTEDKIRNDIDSLQQNKLMPWTVKVDHYDRGWFGSSARVSYSLPLAGQTLRFAVDYKVNQFAIPLQRWARTDYTITPLDASGNNSGNPLAIEAWSIKTFFGRTDTTLKADELHWASPDGNALDLRKLLATIQTEDGKPMQYRMNMAGATLRVAVPTGAGGVVQLVLGNLQADGHQAAMASVKDSWQMDAQQKLESMELLVDNNSVLRLNGLSLDAAMQDKGSLVDMLYHSRAEKGQLGPINHAFAIKDARMDFSYANINKQGYADWQSKANQLYANPGNTDALAMQQASAQALLDSASSLLASSPAFRIDQFGFQTDKGGLHGSLELRFDGNGMLTGVQTAQSILPLLRDRLSGRAAMQLDRGLLNELAGQAAGSADTARTAQMMDASISSAVQQGWLSDNGQRLSADFSFNRDGAVLNGHPLPSMAGLLGGNPAATAPQAAAPAAAPAEENAPDQTPAN